VYAAWGIGISENSEHKAEAWKLVSYLMSPEVNSNSSPLPMPSQAIFMQNLILLLLMSFLARVRDFSVILSCE
jgi:ABC-type glycerol-3-phosphate transport system substrate-binding protein